MASGFGLDGGRGRCFHFWQEFNKCYATADLPHNVLINVTIILNVSSHQREELKQAEKRQVEQAKAKQDALTAAKSNLPKLNIIDDKATEAKA
ncbi:unnamed protein product [Mucor hiemalis]